MYHFDPKLSEITGGTMRDLKIDNDGVGLPVPSGRFLQIPLPTAYVLDTHAKTNFSTFNLERITEADRKTKLIYIVLLRGHQFS